MLSERSKKIIRDAIRLVESDEVPFTCRALNKAQLQEPCVWHFLHTPILTKIYAEFYEQPTTHWSGLKYVGNLKGSKLTRLIMLELFLEANS